MVHPLKKIVEYKNEHKAIGIYSACTASELAIKACMLQAKKENSVLLVEATANQVDQNGGYTGMKPIDFYHFVEKIAKEVGFDMNRIILGGDHLGPLTWTHLNEKEAMENAKVLIDAYVSAGFTKIHIDTSMRVADDSTDVPLSTEVIARRGAELAVVAEAAYARLKEKNPNAIHPVYIVGSEVPIPGGAQEEEEGIEVTKVSDLESTIVTFKEEFAKHGVEKAWDYVIAIVVQPGVEFGDGEVHEYNREAAKALMTSLEAYPNLVFEGHSTDYQTKYALREMVEDKVGILKVGPALTFALREGLFALANIEKAYIPKEKQSHFIEVLEKVMLEHPKNWKKHYHGNEEELAFKRKYSFSDRARYYLPMPEVVEAQKVLFKNLTENPIPLSLLSQFMPIQYTKVREGLLADTPESLVMDRVINCVDEYTFATRQSEIK